MPKKKIFQKFLTTFLLLSFCSCGFQVIYRDEDVAKDGNSSYAEELAAIRIQKDRTRLGQELKNSLYDLLNPNYIKADPKWFLTMTLKKTVSATFITSTGASGRNKVTLDVSYILRNLETAATISTGKTSVNDNYDVSTNRFGTYVADDSVSTNLTKIAAQNIRNSLVNDLIEAKKKCENKDKVKEDENFVCPLDIPKEKPAKKITQ